MDTLEPLDRAVALMLGQQQLELIKRHVLLEQQAARIAALEEQIAASTSPLKPAKRQ